MSKDNLMAQAMNKLQDNNILHYQASGHQLVVEGRSDWVDYWPTTGKWKSRDGSKEGFGSNSLLNWLK